MLPGQGSPRQPYNHENEQLIHLESFCNHTPILFVTFSKVFNKSREIFNTLL